MTDATFDGGFSFTQAELNDATAFARKAEASRQVLVNALAAAGKPINVWTSGQCVVQVVAGHEAHCPTCGQVIASETVEAKA